MAAQEDEAPIEQNGPRWWMWPLIALSVLVGALLYVTTVNFLQLGDGAVGVLSGSLRTTTVVDSPTEPGSAYVLHAPAGAMTIGFPVRNRGLLPVTMTETQPADQMVGLEPGCRWRRLSVRGTPGVSAPNPDVQPFGEVHVDAGETVQLYIEAGFPKEDCTASSDAEVTVADLVVHYRVFGLLPRRQEVSLGLTVTTVFDARHPLLDDG